MAALWASIVDPRTNLVAPRSVISTQALTESAPSAASEGLTFVDVGGWDIWVIAEAAQTLSGAGSLTGYRYDDLAGGWGICPDLTIAIPATVAGNRRACVATNWTVANPRGNIAHIANGITVSGGTTVQVLYVATMLRGFRT